MQGPRWTGAVPPSLPESPVRPAAPGDEGDLARHRDRQDDAPARWEGDHAHPVWGDEAIDGHPARRDPGSGTGGSGRRSHRARRAHSRWYAFVVGRASLPVVLLLQAVLSARLVWSNTAFQDEGLYLWAGHLELDHFLRHSPVPDFATYWSGAPVLYPPIGAMADGIGGLAAARLLSLVFMLIATALLHGVTRRIFGSRATAFFAAALFAGVGSAQFLGAFATYDALALMLLSVATWLGVRSAEAGNAARIATLVLAGLVLVTANATKYVSAMYDPVVVAVVALTVWQRRGRGAGLAAGSVLAATTAALLAGAYWLAGPSYAAGIRLSTFTRVAGPTQGTSVLLMSARWIGIVAALAVVGAVAASYAWQRWPTVLLAWTLAVAALLAPVEQARISTSQSLFKHAGYGAWFAAAVAGYFLAALPNALRKAGTFTLAACVVAVASAAAVGTFIVSLQYRGWPDAGRLTTTMQQLERPGGHYLVEDYDVEAYYLRSSVSEPQWSNTFYFGYTDPATGKYLENAPAYADAIRHRYFTAIVLAFGDTYSTDQEIVADIRRYGGYRLTAELPYSTAAGPGKYEIWTLSRSTSSR